MKEDNEPLYPAIALIGFSICILIISIAMMLWYKGEKEALKSEKELLIILYIE